MSEVKTWFQRVEALYQAALDEPAEARRDFLNRACAGEADLLREVESLLECYQAAKTSFLAEPALRMPKLEDSPESVPQQIGRYRILSRLGEGGMGVVYRAEQENPRRQVALKVIRPGVTARDALRRFELEATVLARLSHPGIGQIFEAGTHVDPGGPRPYFAMELIEGTPLMAYVRERRPDVRSRVALIASLCDAVQYAHLKGVIHRDLKPSNILIVDSKSGPADNDRRGLAVQPKILDFGIARATESDIQATTLHTEVGQVMGTLPYMSPEQVTGAAADIDARADIYALGVLLYEVLAERLPIDVGQRTIAAAARMICEQEPAPLSTVQREFRGDLDTIVHKALEKEPDRRYGSASDLATDLRRYLRHEPIAARPTTTVYQLRKFARRNRGLVAGTLLAFLMLIIGTVVSTALMFQRTKALAESERQRQIAQSVNDFLNTDLLGQANPYIGVSADTRLRDVLDNAGRAIDSRLQDSPLVHASIRATLGKTYFQLSLYEEADRHLSKAIEVYGRELGPADPLTADLRLTQIMTMLQGFKMDQANALLEGLLHDVQQTGASDQTIAAQSYAAQGILKKRQGKFQESEAAYRRALELYDAMPSPPRHKVIVTRQNLALALFDQYRNEEAEALLREVVTDFEAHSGVDSADVAYGLTNLGQVYKKSRPKDEGLKLAMECFERAYDIRVRRLGEDHRETLRTRGCQAVALYEMGRHADAERMQRDVLERRLRIMEADHIDVLDSRYYVGAALEHLDRIPEALECYSTASRLGSARYGPEYYHVRRFRHALRTLLQRTEDHAGLHQLYAEYFAALETATAPTDAKVADLNGYAYWLLNCEPECMRDHEKALSLAQRAYQTAAPDNPNVIHTLAQALAENGRGDDALALLEKALENLNPDDTKRRPAIENQIGAIRAEMLAEGLSSATH